MGVPRPYTTQEWLLVVGVLLLGCAVLGLGAFSYFRGVAPEEELILVEGIPESIQLTPSNSARGVRRSHLSFRLGGHVIQYDSREPRFEEVFAAVDSSEPLRVWISTRQETIVHRDGRVHLYRMSLGGQDVLSYPDVVAAKRDGPKIFLPVGAVILAAGGLALYRGLRKRELGPVASMSPRTRMIVGAAVLSLLPYGVLVGVPLLDPSAHAKMIEAFGPRPWGLPVRFVVVAALTLLYLPGPWIAWHGLQLAIRAREEQRRFGLGYLLFARHSHPEPHWSQRVCWGGLVYYLLLCGAWIGHTSWKGI